MANHDDSSTQSKKLCGKLEEALREKIPNLICEHGKSKCSFRGKGIKFAWVNSHSVRVGRLNIWFIGDMEEAKNSIN
jgi:hypothetical protein